ncbi:MAG: RNA methyltransferase [Chitinophagaceae bacterium]|jgi:TrmH family RNA methyltransferase|nr:RNA methyltransferase [Chitinophagaceae bacterium]
MVSKNEFKYIQSLCHKKQRLLEGAFIAEGPKLLEELLSSNYVIHKIYATQSWLNTQMNQLNTITEISDEELGRMSSLQSPNQVLAIVQQKPNILPKVEGKMNLLLDGIQDPGNLGTIIRIADWFGIENILCTDDTAELYNNKVVQSTMGSFCRLNIWYGNVVEAVLEQNNMPVYGALLNGISIYETNTIKAGILVIGNEGKGIREKILPFIQHPITIPKIGQAESLNAAVATGIIISHLI